MSQTISQNYDELLDEAAGWIARLRSDQVTARDKQDFSRWLNQSDEHCRAFDDMSSSWEATATAAYLPDVESQMQLQTPATPSVEEPQTSGWFSSWSGWQSGLAMACIAGVIALVTLLPGTPDIRVDSYSTGAGEQRQITLADGSIIDLNTRSHLQVSFSEDQRQLRLLRGEAYFQVAKDRERPFVVDVGAGTVTAVGTAFNIHRHITETLVVVTEGIVQLREQTDASTPNPSSERLIANQEASFGKRGLTEIRSSRTQAALAWREKTLIFNQSPLTEAVAELNRYLELPVNLDDESLRDLRVSGTFSVAAPAETLDALMASFDLSLDQQRLYRNTSETP